MLKAINNEPGGIGKIFDYSENPDYKAIFVINEKCLYIFNHGKLERKSSKILNTHYYCDNLLAITINSTIYITNAPEILNNLSEFTNKLTIGIKPIPVSISIPAPISKSISIPAPTYNSTFSSSTLKTGSKPNGSLIKTGNSIIFEVFKDKPESTDWYIAVHVDMVGRGGKTGLIMSAGGQIDHGSNALSTAMKESNEEHGLILSNPNEFILLDSDSNDKGQFHYFLSYVKPTDYNWNNVIKRSTSWEIGKDKSIIPGIYGSQNCIQVGGIQSAVYLVRLSMLLEKKNKDYSYGPFIKNLAKLLFKF